MMWVAVKNLVKICNPLAHPPWKKGMLPISREEIGAGISCGVLKQYPEYDSITLGRETREDHISRIVWLVVNGWRDNPITINFCNCDWVLDDGNHRLGAAIYRRDEMIWSDVYGDLDRIRSLYED